jgi:iron(III) transport system substrate-binding protein
MNEEIQNRFTRNRNSIFFIWTLTLFLIAACSGSSTASVVPEPDTNAQDKITNSNKDILTVYSGRSESLVGPIIDQFATSTGVDVAVKYGKTPQLAATILEEGAKSPADIFFAQDPGGLDAVENLLIPIAVDTLNQVPEWARSTDAKWVGISGRARTVVYNPNNIDESDLPNDMWGFVEPQWNGRIGWAPANASFQTMVTGMRTLWGEDKTREWLNGIQRNEPTIYPKNTPQVAAVARGEIDVGFVNHYYLFRFLAEEGDDFPVRNYHPRAGGPGSVIMVAGAGILESSKNKTTAEKFLGFMLSEIAQQYFTAQTYEYPLIDGVKTSRILVPIDEINHPNMPLSSFADLEGTGKLLRETGILP